MPYRFNSLLPFVNAMPTPANVQIRDFGAARRERTQLAETERSNRSEEVERNRSNLAGEAYNTAALGESTRSSKAREGAVLRDDQSSAITIARDLARRGNMVAARAYLELNQLNPDAYLGAPEPAAPVASAAPAGPAPSLNDDPGVQQQYRELGPADMVVSPSEAGLDEGPAGLPPEGERPFDVPANLGVTGTPPRVPPFPLPNSRMLGAPPDMAITMEEAGIAEPQQGAKAPASDPYGLDDFLASQARTDLGYEPQERPPPAPLPMRVGGVPMAAPTDSFVAPAGLGTEGNASEDAAVAETFAAFVQGEREPNIELAQQIAAQAPGLMKIARASGKDAFEVYRQLKDEYLKRSGQMTAERRTELGSVGRTAGLGLRAKGVALSEDRFLRQLKRDVLHDGWTKYGVGKSQEALKQTEEAMSLLEQATTTSTRDGDALAGRVALMNLVKSLAGARFSDTDLKTVMSAGGKEQTLESWFNEWTQGGQITDKMLQMLKTVTRDRNRMARKQMALAAKKVGESVRANRQIQQYAGGDLDAIQDELEAQTLAGTLPEEDESALQPEGE